ncbi:MAG TPA: sigma-54-dependent Fis family transcriptional regulator, partial [Rhodospirillaceae bacterium]|nr:sigma-54-dependent Fis family transcriptional regulator [Rhodospirillaceae bacterium]
MTKTILIVDDEKDIRALIAGILEDEGYNAIHAASSDEAYRLLETQNVDLMILDIWLEGSAQDGMQILSQVRQDNVLLPVIMISGHGSIETAVEALKEGAYDFIEKPFKTDRLLVMVKRALETASLQKENRKLRSQNAPAHLKLIGASRVYKDFETLLSRVAKTNSRVLLTGESGTG